MTRRPNRLQNEKRDRHNRPQKIQKGILLCHQGTHSISENADIPENAFGVSHCSGAGKQQRNDPPHEEGLNGGNECPRKPFRFRKIKKGNNGKSNRNARPNAGNEKRCPFPALFCRKRLWGGFVISLHRDR